MAVGSITGTLTDQNKAVLDRLAKDEASNKLKEKQQMGKDQFLHLITEQLKMQDPLAPMQDQQFIAQMAQLQALESSNTLIDLAKANYVMNTAMTESLTEMNKNIKLLVEKMNAGTGSGTSNLGSDAQDIVNELVKMNKAMESYFSE